MTKERLEILVVEDKEDNITSATQLLGNDNNLTIATNFIEAVKALESPNVVQDGNYDAVLTDLYFPMGGNHFDFVVLRTQSKRQRQLIEPLGYSIAFFAAIKGVPLIGILTDLDHHAGPIAASFDLFDPCKPIMIDNSKLVMFDNRSAYSIAQENMYLHPDGKISPKRAEGGKLVKDWKTLLSYLKDN